MALPGNWSTVTVTGTFVAIDGTAMTGTVTFATEVRLTNADAEVLIPATSRTVTLDSDGSFSVELPATDDPEVVPGFFYRVTERLGGTETTARYAVQLPAAAPAVDLTDLVPVAEPVDMTAYATLAALAGEAAARAAADVALMTDAVATASGVGTAAFTARALPGATPPSGAVARVLNHAGAVLAEVTAASVNLNVSPAAYSYVMTGVRVYAGPADPDPGAVDGSLWLDTATGVIKTRTAGAWVSPLTPGAWLPLTFEAGAGNPEALSPATVETPAGRVESALAGTVRLRGGVGILTAGGGFLTAVKFATLPAALWPSVIRQGVLRTRGVTSTHTNWTVSPDGSLAVQTTALSAGSTVFLDGITYSL